MKKHPHTQWTTGLSILLAIFAATAIPAYAEEKQSTPSTNIPQSEPQQNVVSPVIPLQNLQFKSALTDNNAQHQLIRDSRDEPLHRLILAQLRDNALWQGALAQLSGKVKTALLSHATPLKQRQHSSDFYQSLEAALRDKLVRLFPPGSSLAECSFDCIGNKRITIRGNRLIVQHGALGSFALKNREDGLDGIILWNFFSLDDGQKGGLHIRISNTQDQTIWSETIHVETNITSEDNIDEIQEVSNSRLGIGLMQQALTFQESGTSIESDSKSNIVLSFGYKDFEPDYGVVYYIGGRILSATGFAPDNTGRYIALSISARVGFTLIGNNDKGLDLLLGVEQDLLIAPGHSATLSLDWTLGDDYYVSLLFESPLESRRTDYTDNQFTFESGTLLEIGIYL